MSTYRLRDFVDPIAITVQDPANSGFERFVGLEHYDSNELVIKRFSGVELLTTNAKAFQKNDLLIARRNVYLRRAGVVYFDGITSGDSIVLRVKENCEKQTGINRELAQRILPLVLNTDKFWIYANKHADGMNSKRISKDTLLDYEFDLPSIEEQKVLADKLWAAYRVKEAYRQLLSTTDDMLKAKFQEMFDFQDLDLTNPTNDFDKYCFDATSSATKIPAGNYLDEGKYAIYDQGQEKDIAGFTNTEDGVNKDYPVILFGDHSRVIKFINEPFFIGADGVKIIRVKDEKTLLPYFLFYDLLYHNIPNTGYNRHFKYIKMLKLTVPPMELQQQFAEIATQAEATKASLRSSIEAIDRVIRSLINQ